MMLDDMWALAPEMRLRRPVDRECYWVAEDAEACPLASEHEARWERDAWREAEDWPEPIAVHPLYWDA